MTSTQDDAVELTTPIMEEPITKWEELNLLVQPPHENRRMLWCTLKVWVHHRIHYENISIDASKAISF